MVKTAFLLLPKVVNFDCNSHQFLFDPMLIFDVLHLFNRSVLQTKLNTKNNCFLNFMTILVRNLFFYNPSIRSQMLESISVDDKFTGVKQLEDLRSVGQWKTAMRVALDTDVFAS